MDGVNWQLIGGTAILFVLGLYLQGFDAVTGPASIRFTAGLCFVLAGIGLCLILNSGRRRE